MINMSMHDDIFDNRFDEMRVKIVNEFVPEFVKRIKESGRMKCDYSLNLEVVGSTINLIISANGKHVQEFAFFLDQFKCVNWMPVFRQG